MKTSHIILTLVCMTATMAHAKWSYRKSVDPLDDSVTHVLTCSPTNSVYRSELSRPVTLVINITGGRPTVGMIARPDSPSSRTYPIIVRFDRKKARSIPCIVSKHNEWLFPEDQEEFLDEITSSDGLIISLDELFGRRTDFFDVRGLTETLKRRSLSLYPKVSESEQSEERPAVQEQAPDPKAVAKARATLNDIARALIYAKERTGQAPKMKSEFELTKPLAALQKAIAEHERKLEKLEKTKELYNRLNAGSISRPSANQLMRAEKEHEAAAAELERAVDHIYEQARQTLQATNWPTPELSEDAITLTQQIPYPRKTNHFRRTTFPSY